MTVLPYQQPDNPWRRTDGKDFADLAIRASDFVDVLVVKTNGAWLVITRRPAIDIAWTGYRDAFVVAFRPSVSPGPAPAAESGGRLVALQEQLQTAIASRDHYKRLWIDAEARRTLGLSEIASLRHQLDQVRDELSGLRSAA